MAGSGILEVEDGGGKAVYCFFLARWSLKWNIAQNQLEFSLATAIFSKRLCSSLPMLTLFFSVSFKGSSGTIWELVTRCLSTQGSSLQALRWSSQELFLFLPPPLPGALFGLQPLAVWLALSRGHCSESAAHPSTTTFAWEIPQSFRGPRYWTPLPWHRQGTEKAAWKRSDVKVWQQDWNWRVRKWNRSYSWEKSKTELRIGRG